MGKTTIEWCDYTFNPWIGCTKVSDGCKHCYAETLMDKRYGKVEWGPQGKRVRTSDANWRKPLTWNKKPWWKCLWCGWRGDGSALEPDDNKLMPPKAPCPACGHWQLDWTRARVFCASLADVFEAKGDQRLDMDDWRRDLFRLIEDTPHLDWLILTKRPENILGWIPQVNNLHFGVSVENQEQADKRIPKLLELRSVWRVKGFMFVSVEPLLGPIDMSGLAFEAAGPTWAGYNRLIDWVIVGGESGPNARPMHPDWARSIRDQCQAAALPFFFKQWGTWIHETQIRNDGLANDDRYALSKCVKTPQDIGLMARRSEWRIHTNGGFDYYNVGKKAAGRLLDGVEHNAFPEVQHAP